MQLNHARKRNFSHGIVCSRLGSVGNAPDFFAVCVQAEGNIAVIDFGRNIHKLKHALRARKRKQNEIELLRDLRYALCKLPYVLQKSNKHAAGSHKTENTEGGRYRIENMRQVVHYRPHDIGIGICLCCCRTEFNIQHIKCLHGFFLMVKGLNNLLPRHHLFNVSVHGCNGFLLTGKILSALFADEFDCKKHNKPHNNNDCKQRNGKNEHHCNDADEGYAGDYQLRDALVQKLADRVNIVCIVTHKLAVRMRVKIAYGKTLHLIKHILAQVAKHRCGAFEHQID